MREIGKLKKRKELRRQVKEEKQRHRGERQARGRN